MQWQAWLDTTVWLNIGIVATATVVIHLVLRSLVSLLRRRLTRDDDTAGGHKGRIWARAIVTRTSGVLLFAFSLLLALKLIDLPSNWQAGLSHGWFVVLALQVALWMDACVRLWGRGLLFHKEKGHFNPVMTTIVSVLGLIVVWAIMLLSILANLGVDITALVASLGVGGIAVALAVQTVLSDIFASLSIGFDKPFEIGDFVVFGDVAGTIEHIGLKTTRIRSLSGEQVVCSNADLLKQTLHNYKRMDTRRIVFTFGISYDTPSDKVRAVSPMLRGIIERQPDTRFDRAHFLSFDESRLLFEVVYIVQSPDYNRYMDLQQEINLQLLEGLRNLEVRFAHPVRNVRVMNNRLPEMPVTVEAQGVPRQSAGVAH